MKNFLTTILLLTLSFGFSQKNEVCNELETQISKAISENDYEKANSLYLEVKTKCLNHSLKMYALVETVLSRNVALSSTENKEKVVLDYIDWLNLLDKNFPENQLGTYQKKAFILYNNKIGNDQSILDNLNKAYTLQRDNFTNGQLLFEYLNLYYNQSKTEKNNITSFDLISRYNEVVGLSTANSEKFPERKSEYYNVIVNSKQILGSVLTCENWNNFASIKFQENLTNISWIENTTTNLHENCKTSSMVETLSLKWLDLEANSKPAYFLGDFYLNKNNQAKAISYFEKSLSLAKSKQEKAATAHVIAILMNISNRKMANEMIEVAIANDPSNAKYYVFQAELYSNASKECATTNEQKAALNQLAYQTIMKAAEVDPNAKKMADSKAEVYMKNVNSFKINKRKSVTLDCFINKKVSF
jgi:tetratricopeptide (TPR) repeat protein